MTTLPLHFRDGHLFVELDGELWLVDTGAPTSFGTASSLSFAGVPFELSASSVGLTAATLSELVGVQCAGLLGGEILGRFDFIFDAARGQLTVSTEELAHPGQRVHLNWMMGIPIVGVRIRGNDSKMFFDTGAQLSYFEDDSIASFPAAGVVSDFYPGAGRFETATHAVPVTVGGVAFTLRCGRLPGMLSSALMMAGVTGIIGNEILASRTVGYFPRRSVMTV